jgi:uncharacterized protein (DUF1330 family)
MSAYVIVNVRITDPAAYAEYVKYTPGSIAEFGGRFVVRGGRAEKLEGDYEPHRVIVLEFDSLERAKEWWASEGYRGPKAIRQRAASTDMIVVEGLATAQAAR